VPVQKDFNSLGGHLRRRRLQLKIFQSEAARRMKVSNRTLSLWECDRLYPKWCYWPRIIAYLGFDPFTDSTLGRPKANETSFVAFLSLKAPITIGQKILKQRMEMRKTRAQYLRAVHLAHERQQLVRCARTTPLDRVTYPGEFVHFFAAFSSSTVASFFSSSVPAVPKQHRRQGR
jgi:DNA-binding XRE family transcriptional regulator